MKKNVKNKTKIDWEKVVFYGVIIGWMMAELYLLLVIATALTA